VAEAEKKSNTVKYLIIAISAGILILIVAGISYWIAKYYFQSQTIPKKKASLYTGLHLNEEVSAYEPDKEWMVSTKDGVIVMLVHIGMNTDDGPQILAANEALVQDIFIKYFIDKTNEDIRQAYITPPYKKVMTGESASKNRKKKSKAKSIIEEELIARLNKALKDKLGRKEGVFDEPIIRQVVSIYFKKFLITGD